MKDDMAAKRHSFRGGWLQRRWSQSAPWLAWKTLSSELPPCQMNECHHIRQECRKAAHVKER